MKSSDLHRVSGWRAGRLSMQPLPHHSTSRRALTRRWFSRERRRSPCRFARNSSPPRSPPRNRPTSPSTACRCRCPAARTARQRGELVETSASRRRCGRDASSARGVADAATRVSRARAARLPSCADAALLRLAAPGSLGSARSAAARSAAAGPFKPRRDLRRGRSYAPTENSRRRSASCWPVERR